MTESLTALIESIALVIDGGEMTFDRLCRAVADPRILRGAERQAWHALNYWADDADIREKDAAYGHHRRRQLAELLTRLKLECD